jgi:hypothetical protein
MGFNGINNLDDPAQQAWMEQFRVNMTAILEPAPAVLAPACVAHEIEDSGMFNSTMVDNIRFPALLHEWLFSGGCDQGGGCHHVDTCQGINCNVLCGGKGAGGFVYWEGRHEV